MTTTTTLSQELAARVGNLLRDETLSAYLTRFRDALMGSGLYMDWDWDRCAIGAVTWWAATVAAWEERHIIPAPPAPAPERAERRRLLAAAAEREAVEDVLHELAARAAGTRAAAKYGRALDALAVGAHWADAADGVLFVTRGNGDHWVDPLEGCDCPGSGDGWRCWAGALAEAVLVQRARASERRAPLAA